MDNVDSVVLRMARAEEIGKLLLAEISRTSMIGVYDCAEMVLNYMLNYVYYGIDWLFDTIETCENDNIYYISSDVCRAINDIDNGLGV